MDQGIKNLDVAEAGQLLGADPDYSIKDVFEAIATGNFCELFIGNSVDMKGVANAQPGPYSYHCIIITAVCSVGGTEVVTSINYYLLPTFSSIIRVNCSSQKCVGLIVSNSLSS